MLYMMHILETSTGILSALVLFHFIYSTVYILENVSFTVYIVSNYCYCIVERLKLLAHWHREKACLLVFLLVLLWQLLSR